MVSITLQYTIIAMKIPVGQLCITQKEKNLWKVRKKRSKLTWKTCLFNKGVQGSRMKWCLYSVYTNSTSLRVYASSWPRKHRNTMGVWKCSEKSSYPAPVDFVFTEILFSRQRKGIKYKPEQIAHPRWVSLLRSDALFPKKFHWLNASTGSRTF